MTDSINKPTQNIACRVFKEQINLINQLPIEERTVVLYLAINNSFNQIDNQNESAYVSVSVSDSLYGSLSVLSKSILDLLSKNIVAKEFSNNYGGSRKGSGSKPKAKDKQSGSKSGANKNDNVNDNVNNNIKDNKKETFNSFIAWDWVEDDSFKSWLSSKDKIIKHEYKSKFNTNFVNMQKEAVINYCKSNNKTYKDYKSALQNFINREIKEWVK